MASLVMDINFQHKHKRYITAIVVALISIALGLALAAIVAKETSGYVAGYTWFILLMGVGLIVAVMLILSLILVFQDKTKWVSIVLAGSSILLLVSYLMSVKTFEKVGWSRYVHEQMVRFGPDVRASLERHYR
jgi:xanthine/uracil permease